MSYTNLYGQPQGKPHYFTNKLREALIAELIAINGYELHIANSNIPAVNQVWHHIMNDEKEHYGNFLTLLRKYDPGEYHAYMEHVKDTYQITQTQGFQPDYNRQIILNNIREDIKGELEAVILYEQIILEMPFQDIQETFNHIIDSEKEHAEHLTKLLISIDEDKYNSLT